MKSGRMTDRLTLLCPHQQTNAFGETQTEYGEVKTIHAERVAWSGGRSEEVGEHFPTYDTRFNIRAAHTVRENWRVQHVGGYLYTVTDIEPNRRRGYLTLHCVRVNE